MFVQPLLDLLVENKSSYVLILKMDEGEDSKSEEKSWKSMQALQ